MTKPRISLALNGNWKCLGNGHWGYGDTVIKAYSNWLLVESYVRFIDQKSILMDICHEPTT